MDVVNPQLIRVGKRIYRKNPIPIGFSSTIISNVEESQPDGLYSIFTLADFNEIILMKYFMKFRLINKVHAI